MIRPLGNKVVVEREVSSENTTESGIILKSSQEPDKAVILAIGPEVNEVQVGDKVLLNWNKATKFEGEQYVVPITEVIFIYE